jgi:hypothetical protein
VETVSISAAEVLVHLLISWIPWLIGTAVGGVLGLLCALGIRAILSNGPGLRRPLVLLPWRTLGMGLLMAAWSPFVVRLLWIGPISGGVMVASSLSVLATVCTASMLMENWYPSPLAARLVGGARTLAVAACLIAVGIGMMGGGGLGAPVLEAARLSLYGPMWKGLLAILAMALALDLALGLVQMVTLHVSRDSGRPATAEGTPA